MEELNRLYRQWQLEARINYHNEQIRLMLQAGLLTPNEVRQILNKPKLSVEIVEDFE